MAKEPPKHRKEWSDAEIKKHEQLAKQNTPTRVAALKRGRTPAAVNRKPALKAFQLRPTNQRPYGTRK